MKKIIILIILVLVLLSGVVVAGWFLLRPEKTPGVPESVSNEELPPVLTPKVVAQNISIPWDIAFIPEGMLVSERTGNLLLIGPNNDRTTIAIDRAEPAGEGGLLGLAIHPNFLENRLIYLYLTAEGQRGLVNRVERYRFQDGTLSERIVIIDNIPGARYHDGGRIEFGPDGKLYVTTGDAQNENLAQDTFSLAGKILRLNDDGTIPEDNPFGNAVWSYGHRNPQGLAWDESGNLWSTEHGRSGIVSGFDEINLIGKGGNYGWPYIEGGDSREGMIVARAHSGSEETWAPASALYYNSRLFFGGLRGEALFEAVLSGTEVVEIKKHFFKEYGRIRTVRLGPDGMFYLTTSNRDGRGSTESGDDKIIRLDPRMFE